MLLPFKQKFLSRNNPMSHCYLSIQLLSNAIVFVVRSNPYHFFSSFSWFTDLSNSFIFFNHVCVITNFFLANKAMHIFIFTVFGFVQILNVTFNVLFLFIASKLVLWVHATVIVYVSNNACLTVLCEGCSDQLSSGCDGSCCQSRHTVSFSYRLFGQLGESLWSTHAWPQSCWCVTLLHIWTSTWCIT